MDKFYELQIYRKSDNTLIAKGADADARKEWKEELTAQLPAGSHVNNGDYYAINHDPEGVELDSPKVDLVGFDIPQKTAPAPAASEAPASSASADAEPESSEATNDTTAK